MLDKIDLFMRCCFKNMLILMGAGGMMYYSPLELHEDPIILTGYFVVYLELSKLLLTTATGVEAPILIRYVFAAITVGAAIKVYENMIHFDMLKILVFTGVSLVFLLLRWLAIFSTRDVR